MKFILPKAFHIEILYTRHLFDDMVCITTSQQAEAFFKRHIPIHHLEHKERCWVILLNRANRVLGMSHIGTGSTSGVMINLKEIVQLVCLSNASSIILAHNHPSGRLMPSKADEMVTERCREVLKFIEVELIDHIILTSEDFALVT